MNVELHVIESAVGKVSERKGQIMETTTVKTRSGLRRSLLGLAIIAVPISVLSNAAVVSAGANEVQDPQVSFSCRGVFVNDEYDDNSVDPSALGGIGGTFYDGPVLIIDTDGDLPEPKSASASNGYDEDEFDVLIFEGDVEDDWESEDPIKTWEQVDSGTFYHSVDEGTYTVVIDYYPINDLDEASVLQPQDRQDFVEVIRVSCPTRKRPTPTPTPAPVLPQTGSESSTLLVVAPMMVLLGGGLILARRRFTNA